MRTPRSNRAGGRTLALAVLVCLLPLAWIPAAVAEQAAPCCTEQHLHAGDSHGACPQHQCCVGTADSPAPRPTGTPLGVVITPVPRSTGPANMPSVPATTPSRPPITRTHGAGLPLLC